jgi:predicted RNA-binding Zn ribbon-like protein
MSEFEYSGGALCLDFCNTWGDRSNSEKDLLTDYGDLLRWAVGTGAFSAAEQKTLEKTARRSGKAATTVFGEAIAIREAVFRICAVVAAGAPPAAADLETLNRHLESIPQRHLCCGGSCCEWRWPDDQTDLRRVMWPVVRSAGDLLTSTDADRIRQCEAPDCSWLFLDRSRGGRRRWCDMSVCGNRAKARRYYDRHNRNS